MKRTIISAIKRLSHPTLGSALLPHGLARFFSLAPDRSLTAAKPIANEKKRQLLIAILLTAVLTVTALPYSITHFAPLAPKRALAASNPITIENAQPGSTGWQFDTDSTGGPLEAANHEIEGYASATSVNKGNQISFMVSLSSSAQYTMNIYRMGYYNTGTNPDGTACTGCGGRLMQSIGPLNGSKQATCPTTTTTTNFGLTECHWAVAYTLTVPTTWTTGVYLVKLRRSGS